MTDATQLLRDYAELGSEPAFRELVSRYTDLVETLNELEARDRDALLLRFYERRDLREIGVELGVSEDAAQKRVARALDKLRGLLAARGVALGAAGLAGLLTEGTVKAAPSALAGRASEAACAAAAVGVGSGLLGWLLATTQAKLAAGLVVARLIALPLWWHAGSRNPAGDGTAGEVGGSASLAAPVVESGAQHEAAVASAWTFARPALSKVDPDALTLIFVTADTGSPVPNVAVDYWCRHGESVDRRTLHGTRLGVCEVRFPRHSATELRLTSQCEGFADTRFEWRPDRGEAIPFEYTLRLERAVPIGGTVVDPDGQPVASAKVSFGHSHHDNREAGRPQNHLFSSIQVETDAEGSSVRPFASHSAESRPAVRLVRAPP